MKRQLLHASLTLSCCALLICMNNTLMAGDGVKLEGRLAATAADPLASGKAKFEVRSDRIRASVEVEDVSAAAVEIRINGVSVAVLSVNAFGTADWNVDSRDGDLVPPLAPGDLIEVFDTEDGALILSGTLG